MTRLTLLLLATLLAGCDAIYGTGVVPSTGRFSATVRGAFSADLRGEAAHYPQGEAASGAFALYLQRQEVDFAGYIHFEVPPGGGGGMGRYPVGPGGTTVVYQVDTRSSVRFTGLRGELVVTEANGRDLHGTFAFDARSAEGDDITVEGAFRAGTR